MRIIRHILLLCGPLLLAQSPTGQYARPEAFLTVSATRTNASVTFQVPGERDVAKWEKLLSASVQCERHQGKAPEIEEDPEEPWSAAAVYCKSLPRTPAGHALQIDLVRLREALQARGIKTVYLYAVAPKGTLDLQGKGLRTWNRWSMFTVSGAVAVRDLPASIDIRIEHPLWKLPVFLASLSCLFGLALLGSGYNSWRARIGPGSVAERWFRIYLCISLRSVAVWLGLWAICAGLGGVALLREALNLQTRFADAMIIAALVACGAAVNIAGAAMEAPRYRDVRGLPIGVGEILRLELLKDICVAFVALVFPAIDTFPMQGFTTAFLPMAVILIPATIAGRIMQKTIGIRPFAASHGDLRDAVFQLAARGGVTLKNLYVLPITKWKLVNAFASRGNNVMLSQALVESLSKREVDALAAHELTHVKENHLRRIGLRTGVVAAPLIVLVAVISVFSFENQVLDVMPFAILVLWLLSPAIRRKYEWQADAGAAVMTGDPEAVITGLVKITRLNYMPLRFEKPWCWLITHPSTIRRVQAIARAWQIPQERVAALINVDLEETGPRYSISEAETSDARVFSTEFKSRAGLVILAATIAVLAGGTVAVSVVARSVNSLPVRIAIDAAGVLAVAAFDYAVLAWITGRQNRTVGGRIRRKLEREGVLGRDVDATFVSLTPSSSLRLYEGRYEWDAGYLWMESGRLIYRGELASFDVAPADVPAIRLAVAPRGLPAARRLYLRLLAGPGERTVGLRPLGHVTLRGGRFAVEALDSRVRSWHVSSDPPAMREAVVSVPHESEVTSQTPATIATTAVRAGIVFGAIAMIIDGMLPVPQAEILLMIPAVVAVNLWARVRPLRRYRADADTGELPETRRQAAAQ